MTTWFIDGGAHRGESIRLARKLYGDSIVPIGVEPASECWADLVAAGALLVPAALWTSEGHTALYRGDHEVSSTVIREKHTGGIRTDSGERVPTVSLDAIIRAVPRPDDIIVKLDIEGAEYAVLEQALANGVLGRVGLLFVDFHGDRITNFPWEQHVQLVERLLVAGFDLPKWIPAEGRIVDWGRRWLDRT